MQWNSRGTRWAAVVLAMLLGGPAAADSPVTDPVVEAAREMLDLPRMERLVLRVVDADGHPVAEAKVTPYALSNSQGFGFWREDDLSAGVGPQSVATDAEGRATVLYPVYWNREERARTRAVSLQVDHPDFPFVEGLRFDVPQQETEAKVELAAGVPVEVRPVAEGEPVTRENLFAIWSDGRAWETGHARAPVTEGVLRSPALPVGDNSVLLVRLDGERATHFSKITDFELAPGEPRKLDVALRPAMRVRGALSDNVPRPVRQGRVKARTLCPVRGGIRVAWWTWVPIEADGSFTIDWPAGEAIQLIALCEGYSAAKGTAPYCVARPPDPKIDTFGRAQVFEPREGATVEVAMVPLADHVVTALDEDEKPVAGITVQAWSNVAWWNAGSEVYCHPLARCERWVRVRDYFRCFEDVFPFPFEAETDARGQAALRLPAGEQPMTIRSDVYELPVFLGHRSIYIDPGPGKPTETVLSLQPRGTEQLGDWDKLAGVVFGCSTREGRRIRALPGMREKMYEFTDRYREAKNQRDPQLLSEAYKLVADAFAGVGDTVEAAKWRKKAAQQAKLAESGNE